MLAFVYQCAECGQIEDKEQLLDSLTVSLQESNSQSAGGEAKTQGLRHMVEQIKQLSEEKRFVALFSSCLGSAAKHVPREGRGQRGHDQAASVRLRPADAVYQGQNCRAGGAAVFVIPILISQHAQASNAKLSVQMDPSHVAQRVSGVDRSVFSSLASRPMTLQMRTSRNFVARFAVDLEA
jgi:hypothetical protein